VTRRQLCPLLLLPLAAGCSRPPAPPAPEPVQPPAQNAWRRDESWFSYTPSAQPDRVYFGRLLAHLRLPSNPARLGSDRILWVRFVKTRWQAETAPNYRGPLIPEPLLAALEPFLTEPEEIYFWAFNVGDTPEFRQEALALEADLRAGKFLSADEEP
jgi:hypothetical protein